MAWIHADKVTFSASDNGKEFTNDQKDTILSMLQVIYEGSPTARKMIDDWFNVFILGAFRKIDIR
jgi:hypothetical protein